MVIGAPSWSVSAVLYHSFFQTVKAVSGGGYTQTGKFKTSALLIHEEPILLNLVKRTMAISISAFRSKKNSQEDGGPEDTN
jgi:hypothetical protein